MSEDTTTFLSDCLVRCQKTYITLCNYLLNMEEVTEELRENVQESLDDLGFYLNSILENSTPEYWSDAEYAWIEGVCAEMKEAH